MKVTRFVVPALVSIALLLSSTALEAAAFTSEVDGIRVELTTNPGEPRTKGKTEYVARLVDRAGKPVTGAQVTLRATMPDGMSVVAPLVPAVEAGMYRGVVLFTMEGTWELTLRVTRDGKRFELPLTERVGR